MTTQIAHFMKRLEDTWDAHVEAVGRGDLEAALAPMSSSPSVTHLPAMTGAAGRDALAEWYRTAVFGRLPGDLRRSRRSRTVDRFRIVDETVVSFTHDRELPWLLPRIAPTGHRASVLAIAVVEFDRGRLHAQRILWDQATLAAQLELTRASAIA